MFEYHVILASSAQRQHVSLSVQLVSPDNLTLDLDLPSKT